MGPHTVPPIRTTLGLVIRETDKQIESRIKRALYKSINRRIRKAINKVRIKLEQMVVKWLLNSPEIHSLMSNSLNSLKGDFGLENPAGDVAAIIAAVQSSVEVVQIPAKPTLSGYVMKVQIQPKSMKNVLSNVQSQMTEKGESLPWIEWLLLKGDAIINTEYHVRPMMGSGRSGLATMTKPGSYTVGRVNPAYSGTKDDNFITRALEGREIDVAKALVKGLESI